MSFERTIEQRLTALESANDIRHRRSQLKTDIKGGNKLAADVLEDPPEYIETMKVFDLLLAAPGYGRVKVNTLMSACDVHINRRVGGLTLRQRDDLAMKMRRGTSRVH